MFAYVKTFVKKWSKDNVGMLAAVIAWNLLTSLVPVIVGLLAITGFVLLWNPGSESVVVGDLSSALHGVLTTKDLKQIASASMNHAGLLGIAGFLGILWGGANVGGAISTSFQAIFETQGRNFFLEKLLDAGMIFVLAALMVVIIAATTAGTLITKLISGFPLGVELTYVVGAIISIVAAFILFAAVYLAFPNVKLRFKGDNVWKGALVSAVLFTALSYIWPIYAHFAHFSRYGAVLFPILMLTAWLYLFATIVCIGAEIVAIGAIDQAHRESAEVGPEPDESVPQHHVLRSGGESPEDAGQDGAGEQPRSQSREERIPVAAGRE